MIKGFQIDLARQIERPEFLLDSIRRLGQYDYNLCMLYLESAYAFPGLPGIGRKHAYSPEFMRQIHAVCRETGMELVPVFPALGHCGYITRNAGYEKYDEGYGIGECYGTLVAGRDDVYALLTTLFADWCSYLPGKYIHVGLDESLHMGLSFIREQGQANFHAADMFAAHCNRLCAILARQERRMIMWGDMLYYFPEAIDQLNREIIVADWYYYGFDRTPRVEAFNFSEIDLSGDLKHAGFQVWGVPSSWQYPFPDVTDRLANLRSWQRYGAERGIDGIVNTDWENSFGVFSTSELLFATFARMAPPYDETLLQQAIADTIEEMTGTAPGDDFIQDVLQLGKSHLIAHANRIIMTRPVLGMVNTAPARTEEFRQKAEALQGIFPNLTTLIASCQRPEGRDLLTALSICQRMLSAFWRSCTVMSEMYSGLLTGRIETSTASAALLELAATLEDCERAYSAYWARVRYADDPRKFFHRWAGTAAAELRRYAEQLLWERPLLEHPLFTCPLLEIEMECAHPALPVLEIEVHWHDGAIQKTSEIMIRFESAYAVPDKIWRQYAAIPLEQSTLPAEIVFSSNYYGQIGLRQVKVCWKGEIYHYAVSKTEGVNISVTADALLIGPIAETVADPTHRITGDKAYYQRI